MGCSRTAPLCAPSTAGTLHSPVTRALQTLSSPDPLQSWAGDSLLHCNHRCFLSCFTGSVSFCAPLVPRCLGIKSALTGFPIVFSPTQHYWIASHWSLPLLDDMKFKCTPESPGNMCVSYADSLMQQFSIIKYLQAGRSSSITRFIFFFVLILHFSWTNLSSAIVLFLAWCYLAF